MYFNVQQIVADNVNTMCINKDKQNNKKVCSKNTLVKNKLLTNTNFNLLN